MVGLHRKSNKQTQQKDKQGDRRIKLSMLIILFLTPVTLLLGVFVLDKLVIQLTFFRQIIQVQNYYIISMLIIFYTMVPFFAVFERRRPQARELVIIAVLTAVAVIGRAAFFLLPQFKPVAAIVIITGVCFGAESGFMVGALSAFVSNIFFGQGTFTPWQMFSFGIIGFLAGILFKRGILKKSVPVLCIFGGLSTFLIYGGIMNVSALLTATSKISKQALLAVYLNGILFDITHAAATIFFLAVLSRPMIEKLDRIKKKYGLIEP